MPQPFTQSGVCHSRAHCAACQNPGEAGTRFRLSLIRIGLTGLPADGAAFPCPHGMDPPPLGGPGVGPGTELKKLLARLGINVTPTCGCNARAREMDERGAVWCKDNVETIVDWLEEEHEARQARGERVRWPFTRLGAKLIVRAAIRRGAMAVYRRENAKSPTPPG